MIRETLPSPWLLRGAPGPGDYLIFAFHYIGTGAASSYHQWPEKLGDGVLCPIQPPGREARIVEDPVTELADFAAQLAAELLPYLDRQYAFVGHCGAFPYAVETARNLAALGAPAPAFLVASSWGAPQLGLYGRLNFADLDTVDLHAEIDAITAARTGAALPRELRDLAAETLMEDLRVLRSYRWSGGTSLPAPVLVVSWSDDDVVPPAEVWPSDWRACGPDITHEQLKGDHWEFLRAPQALVDLITGRMSAAMADAAQSNPPNVLPTPDRARLADSARMRSLIYGHLLSRALCVVAKLGIADLMEAGPKTATWLAEVTGAQPDLIARLLADLVPYEVFESQADGSYALAPLGRTLLSSAPGSALPTALIVGAEIGDSWNALDVTVQGGGSAFETVFGTDFFSYMAGQPQLQSTFFASQARGMDLEIDAIVDVVKPVGDQLILDIGGGDGTLLTAVLTAFPDARGLLLDQESAATKAVGRVAAAGLARRCSVVVGDFFEEIPPSADIHVLRHILHDWDDEAALRILRRCRESLGPDGRIVIVETLLAAGAGAASDQAAALMDLYMMAVVGGRERTADQFRALLERADLAEVGMTAVSDGTVAIEAQIR
ncbi:methyltransferase [Krasilnikovia sp. MM14-A1259]|uniref:methyltransferase n=1 Tax=Krasilnikovia sp. MM14-A1259 TaxID=3373539 RepID=UPI00380D2B0E